METAEILARLAKYREFEVATARGWKFQLRLPSEFRERCLAAEALALTPGSGSERWMHDMLVGSVIGWAGPTLDDLLHDGDMTALVWSPEMAETLIDDDRTLLDELTNAYHAERAARKTRIAAAVKN